MPGWKTEMDLHYSDADKDFRARARIVAIPSPNTGEMGCAFIIPRAGQTIDLTEIRQFLDAAGLARQKFPEHVVLVDDLPRVPSGKVRKDVLRIRAKELADALVC
jgi:non-ribosomal peptide synthetase component E (peptide arylation enzyme)